MIRPDRLTLGFPPEVFSRRREKVFESLAGGVMVLPAAPLLHRSRDTEHRYRPDSDLFYLTGATDPGTVAVLRDVDDGARYVLFVRERNPNAERWSGPRLGPEAAAEALGADSAHPLSELEDRLPGLIAEPRRIHYRLRDGGSTSVVGRTRAAVIEALERARRKGPRKGTGPRSVVDPGEILDELRLIKDDAEVERIRRAAEVTVDGFREGLSRVGPGAGEWEVEAAVEAAFRGRGARGTAFPTIVGSGDNACVLHYVANADRMEEGELVLVDGGAEVDLYHGDVTRTVPVSGRFTPEQRAIYEIVEQARSVAVDAVAPGVTAADVHRASAEALVDGLLEVGLLIGDREEVLEAEAHQAYFPHRTSHWLGLDVHDPGDYGRDGESRRLEPGMVLTVEPGLYVPEPTRTEGADEEDDGKERFVDREAAEPFLGIGVRIEDDVLVTGEGSENLTADLPTSPDAVADLVGEG